jgi:hypothetical protein
LAGNNPYTENRTGKRIEGSKHDHGDPDLSEEHAGGDHRCGDKSEPKFGMKMIGIVGVSLMISYILVTSVHRSDFKMDKDKARLSLRAVYFLAPEE